ncbi:MAG: hypothetical protein ACRCZO_01245, partial [Cetobacterium sp.]
PFEVNELPDKSADLLVHVTSLPLRFCACLWVDAQEAPTNKKTEETCWFNSSVMKKVSVPSHHLQWVTAFAVQSQTKVSSV